MMITSLIVAMVVGSITPTAMAALPPPLPVVCVPDAFLGCFFDSSHVPRDS